MLDINKAFKPLKTIITLLKSYLYRRSCRCYVWGCW